MNALEITTLHKKFGAITALRGISLSVAEGQIFGFLGPNGAGKSTTIRCIMDYIRPTSGQVMVFGQDARAQSTQLKQIVGYVPAEPNLYADWTVDDHVKFVAHIRGIKAATADKFITSLGLERKPKTRHLSTGNQQKLAIVLALMANPKLLILDEPTRGLDPLLQATFHELLREYSDGGGTVFLSSHNLTEVDELCTEVAVIKQGELVASSSLDHFKQRSLHNIRATFTGKVPNLAKLKAEKLVTSGTTVSFQFRGDINLVLQELSKHSVQSIEIARATLEDMFMELYQ